MSSSKNSSNIYSISKLAKTYIVQGLVGTREKIANSTSDQIIKYDKFEFFSLISLRKHERRKNIAIASRVVLKELNFPGD